MTTFVSLRRLAFILPFLMFCLFAGLLQAQPKQQTTDLADALATRMDQIEATLSRDNLSDSTINDLRAKLTDITEEATRQQAAMEPTLQEARARLQTLQPAEPEEGAQQQQQNAEARELIERRTQLEKQISQLDAEYKLLTSSLVRAEQLANKITITRQERFTRQLLGRSSSIINPLLWVEAASGLATTTRVTTNIFKDWGEFLLTHAASQIWQVVGMLVIVAVLLGGPFRYLLFSGLYRLSKLENPTPLQRSIFAAWAVIVYTVLPISIFLAITLVLSNADLLPTRVEALARAIATVLFNCSVAYGMVSVLLSINRPNYRLLNVDTSAAIRLQGIGVLLLVIYAVEALADKVNPTLLIPLETEIVISGVASLLIAGLVWTGQRLLMNADPLWEVTPTDEDEQASGFSLPGFIGILRPLVWLACIIIAIAPFLGFVSLADFIAEQLARIFVILVLLGILSSLVDNFITDSMEHGKARTESFSKVVGIPINAINQFGVFFNGILRVFLYVCAALLIFTPWGLQSTDFLTSLKNAVFNIQIGDINISPINILGALLVFAVALVLVKSIQRWMERRLLPATNLDTGLKNSIQTSVGYVGFILAAMLAFSFVGLDLSNIALVAGALSVGIGFGLQSIVNNFVSGLILLVERPIKTGDWVVVGEHQGFVQKISVRATKIETFDRATVILPNSELISNRVMNWMHNGSMGRIIVAVGVSYNSDPDKVRDILLRVADESPLIASYPEPSVVFLDFGASSLDFDVRCYVHDVLTSLMAASELRYAIFKAFKEEGIEIPYPQQDVYIRSVNMPEKEQILPPETPPQPAHTPEKLRADEVDIHTDDSDAEGPDGNATN